MEKEKKKNLFTIKLVYCLVIEKLKREIIKQFPKECQDKILEKIWQSPNEILKFLSAPNFNKVTGITKVPQKRKKKKEKLSKHKQSTSSK